MRDPKERESEHILDVVEIELLPIDILNAQWEEALAKATSKSPKEKKLSFLASTGLDCLDDDEKAFFGIPTRNKHAKHRQVIELEAFKQLKSEIIAETVEVIQKFKEEMDRSFLEFRHNMGREFTKRHRHQMKKLERLLKKQRTQSQRQIGPIINL